MKLHTLKDFELACGNTIVEFGYCPPHIAEWLRKEARRWIKYLEHQKELHYLYVSNCIGDDPSCEIPKGFNIKETCALPWGYDGKIKLIKKFFNLE